MDKTLIVQIGNSDNKLTQSEWAHFIARAHNSVSLLAHEIHFKGHSEPDAPWQNVCWVFVPMARWTEEDIAKELSKLAREHNQESIALTIGDTQFCYALECSM
jgi:hypothetical protein